jgi:hypothetical protein
MCPKDPDIEGVLLRLEQLEEQNNRQRKSTIEDEIWLVYDPSLIQVWCSKVDCPHLNRVVEKEIIEQTVTVDENLADILDAKVGDKVDVEVVVHSVSSPRANNHPLGVVATFGTEREASKWVENFYKKNRFDDDKVDQQFCIAQVTL